MQLESAASADENDIHTQIFKWELLHMNRAVSLNYDQLSLSKYSPMNCQKSKLDTHPTTTDELKSNTNHAFWNQ